MYKGSEVGKKLGALENRKMANEAGLSSHIRGLGFILSEWEATDAALKWITFLAKLSLAFLGAKMLNYFW